MVGQVGTLAEDLRPTKEGKMKLSRLMQRALILGSQAPLLGAPLTHIVM